MDCHRRRKRSNRHSQTGKRTKQAREIFNIKPGDTLVLFGDEERGIAIPPKSAFDQMFGFAFNGKDVDDK